MSVVVGIHPVREALLSEGPIDCVVIVRGAGGHRLQEIIDLCRQRSVPVRFEDRRTLEKLSGSASSQGVMAMMPAEQYTDRTQVLAKAQMVVVLDGVEDPHNLGAVVRTAHAAGAGAVVIPERRAAGLTETVTKAAAGALAHMAVVRVGNLGRALDELKADGYWIYGLDQRGDSNYDTIEYTPPSALVLGGEGKGLHQHVRKRCDFLVRIPLAGRISSLNVSVAAGIALFEWKRRRSKG